MQNLATKQVEASKEANRIANAGPTTAILASDSDAVERLREEVAQAEALQARMKAANPLARKKDVAGLMALGFSENVATRLTQPNVCGGIGFQPYQLSNNSANIRRMKQRLSYLESVKALKPTVKELPGGVRLEEDPEAVRLRLHFPGKPAANVIAALKSNGFRWAPSEGAWQRQLSNAARYAAQQVLKLVEAA